MQKILCIIGPTATGKTSLALSLANKFPSVIISADSRQVYKGMDIVTGKDHPKSINLKGVDLVDPDANFSVSDWLEMIKESIQEAKNTNKLVIVVGGTGFYVKALLDPPKTLHTPPSEKLRASFSNLSLGELQAKLYAIDKDRYQNMNNSDVNNPRRLIRAIEVALSTSPKSSNNPHYESKIIGLTNETSSDYVKSIKKRVKTRLDAGAIDETESLIKKYHTASSLTAIGYKSIMKYLSCDISYDQMVSDWTMDEYKYSKKQLLYFKKFFPSCVWYQSNAKGIELSIEKEVKTWYDMTSINME